MIKLLPLWTLILGILIFAMATNVKVSEVGEIMFATGLLAFLLDGGGWESR
jgi:hypothetical protein